MGREPPPRMRSRRGWIAAGLAVAVVIACAALWPSQARPGSTAVAVFAPWMPRDAVLRAVARDGVHILGASFVPGVVFVSADDSRSLIGLYQAGAWSLMNVDGFAGCFGHPAVAAAAQDGGRT